ncbi:MAG TPA: LPXTG cell wall anchor domain-containing protein [Candidatus Saccharimonadales bacterium]|nr:LPXTG cell wall anchor domain-containing protein [Candidatus Saccharimonadales bacterium]
MNKLYFITAVIVVTLGAAVTTTTPVNATNNTTTCAVKSIGKKNTAGNADSRFVLSSNGTISATFEVTGKSGCKQDVTLASWQAPNAEKGRPYGQQKLYKHVTGTFGTGKHTLTVELPKCYYQVDLVRGSKPTGKDGGPVYKQGRMMGSLHGGTKECKEDTPKTTETLKTSTPQISSATTELPHTGSGSLAGIFAGTTVLGTLAHFVFTKRRNGRS